MGDDVKWANSSASLDEHCAWGTEELTVMDAENMTSSSTLITFGNSSESLGTLQLCYRFSNGSNPYKLYPSITIDVYKLYSVPAAEEGSILVSVIGHPKVLTFAGFGVAEFDQARWILQGKDCSSNTSIAPMVAESAYGQNTSILDSNLKSSFTFSVGVFTLARHTSSQGANATLCYRFGSEDFQHYPTISMDLRHITGWDSSVGSADVAVVDVSEVLSFTGYGIASYDRARWIISGTNCSLNIASIWESSSGSVDISDSGIGTFTFKELTSGASPRLCYWFANEPAMVYPSLTINVAFLSELTAPSFGDVDVAVVDYPKPWGFEGGHIENGDHVQWIFNESSNCTDPSSLVEMS
ncbi:unnamed protein product, partial [Choristocarpus tenellus]